MKKFLFFILICAAIVQAQEQTYLSEMDGLISDAKVIKSALVNKTLESLSSDAQLEAKLSAYELKSEAFIETLTKDTDSYNLAIQMLDRLDALSEATLSLSNSIVELADKTSSSSNDSYQQTIKELSNTILRLSDDIGLMADRIGEMADRIGDMADRIVYTEELISKNAKVINDSMLSVLDEVNTQQAGFGQNIPSSMPPSIQMIPSPTQRGGF